MFVLFQIKTISEDEFYINLSKVVKVSADSDLSKLIREREGPSRLHLKFNVIDGIHSISFNLLDHATPDHVICYDISSKDIGDNLYSELKQCINSLNFELTFGDNIEFNSKDNDLNKRLKEYPSIRIVKDSKSRFLADLKEQGINPKEHLKEWSRKGKKEDYSDNPKEGYIL